LDFARRTWSLFDLLFVPVGGVCVWIFGILRADLPVKKVFARSSVQVTHLVSTIAVESSRSAA
jgi:hypothetical protein